MISHMSHVMTLANSIIGVSVLAMPFCFKQCGIILATLVLLLSSTLSRLACHFLVKSAVMSRRRNFELLAFHAFGHMGKFLVELFIIGFLVGTCIAFFVVMGDLGPQIVGKFIGKKPEDIRTSLLLSTSIFIVLPLGLLRNIDSLSSISTATIVFYVCLVLKVIAESTQHIFMGNWTEGIYYWRPAGILQCLPIFSMALFCQTQLFEIYESIPNVSLEKMNQVVRGALNICTLVYLCVGFFGYVGFCNQPFTGNILMSFEPSLSAEMIKLGFVFSVAFSFPLVIFPCRASLNSLLFRRVFVHEPSSMNYMPETRFRCLTIAIIGISVITGILMPNIEFVLGLVGSTIGVMICLIFPAAFFISISSKNTNERLLAQVILFIGIWIIILGTYANLYAMEESTSAKVAVTTTKSHSQMNNLPLNLIKNDVQVIPNVPNNLEILSNIKGNIDVSNKEKLAQSIRQEPPIPVERIVVTEKLVVETEKSLQNIINNFPSEIKKTIEDVKMLNENVVKKSKVDDVKPEKKDKLPESKIVGELQKNDNLINSDAIKKEELELAADGEEENMIVAQRHEKLRKTLEKYRLEQMKMMQEQKKLLKDIKEQEREFERKKQKMVQNVEGTKKNDKDLNNNKLSTILGGGLKDLKNEKKQDSMDRGFNKSIPKSKEQHIDKVNDSENLLNSDRTHDTIINIVKDEKKLDKLEGLIVNNSKSDNLNVEIVDTKEEKKVPVLKSSVSDAKADLSTIKSKGTLLNTLTKKILLNPVLNNVLTDKNQGEKQEKNSEDVKNLGKSKTDIKTVEDQRFVPIALKLRNQSNIEKSAQSGNNSDNEVQVMRRDILENHEREKRETDDMVKTNLKTMFNDSISVNHEECSKLEKDSLLPKILQSDIASTLASHVQMNTNLTEENSTDIIISNDSQKVKQRDLKALNFDE